MSGYIYLIHLREFINSKEDIYKISLSQKHIQLDEQTIQAEIR